MECFSVNGKAVWSKKLLAVDLPSIFSSTICFLMYDVTKLAPLNSCIKGNCTNVDFAYYTNRKIPPMSKIFSRIIINSQNFPSAQSLLAKFSIGGIFPYSYITKIYKFESITVLKFFCQIF